LAAGPRRSPDWRFALALAVVAFVGPLAIHSFMPIMPHVQRAFDIPQALVGLTFSVTLFTMAFTTLAYGSFSDRHGRRPVLLAGLALFTAGSVIAALATSVVGLVVGRALQAAGAGCGATLSRAIAADAYGQERLVKVLAYLTMAYTVGPMIAPLVGGLLADAFGWRSVLWFAALAGGAILASSWRVLYETRAPELRRPRATSIPRDLVTLARHPRFAAFVLQAGFSTAAFMAMASAASFLMQDYLGRPASEFGAYFFVLPLGFFLGSWISSRLAGRVSVERMVLVGSSLSFVGVCIQSALILAGILTPLVLFLPGMMQTVAQGIALPNTQTGAMRVVPTLAGTAAGLGVFCQMFLGAIGAQLYALLADGTPWPMVETVFVASALMFAAGVACYRLRPDRGH
jgi:MFS transporter, DHA1 family, multidrug resistance protein